mgnify:CR=1 FL=1
MFYLSIRLCFWSYFIIDQQVTAWDAIKKSFYYIGALGSQNTHSDRCERLKKLGVKTKKSIPQKLIDRAKNEQK